MFSFRTKMPKLPRAAEILHRHSDNATLSLKDRVKLHDEMRDFTFEPDLQNLLAAITDTQKSADSHPYKKTAPSRSNEIMPATKMYAPPVTAPDAMFDRAYAGRKAFGLQFIGKEKAYNPNPILHLQGGTANIFELAFKNETQTPQEKFDQLLQAISRIEGVRHEALPAKNPETGAYEGTYAEWKNLNEAFINDKKTFKSVINPEPKVKEDNNKNFPDQHNVTDIEKLKLLREIKERLLQNPRFLNQVTDYNGEEIQKEEMKQKFAYLTERLNEISAQYEAIFEKNESSEEKTAAFKKLEEQYQPVLPFLKEITLFADAQENLGLYKDFLKSFYEKEMKATPIPEGAALKRLQFAVRKEARCLEKGIIGRLKEMTRAHPSTAKMMAGVTGGAAIAAQIASYFIPGGFALQFVTAPVALACLGVAAPGVKRNIDKGFNYIYKKGEDFSHNIGRAVDTVVNRFRAEDRKTDFNAKAAEKTFPIVSGILFSPLQFISDTIKSANAGAEQWRKERIFQQAAET